MEPPADRRPRRSRAWVGFFALLAALAAAAVALPILYNLGQQLRPEQLDAARRRWHENGPKDYDLTFSVAYDRERLAERHIVLVRGGKVVLAACEGEVVSLAPALAALVGLPLGGTGTAPGRDVPAIFDHIADLLREQTPGARRNFVVAAFDPKDGHPRRFIFRVRGTSTREEWNLRLWPAGALDAKR
jgi:hypothetical protein